MITSMRIPTALSSLALCALAAGTAAADTIYLVSGEELEARTIVLEGLKEVTYKDKGNKERTVPTEEVVRVEYDSMPDLLAEADISIESGELGQAVYELTLFLDGVLEGNDKPLKKHPWSAAYAATRIVELQESQGAHDGVVAAVDRLLANYSDTRFMPEAHLAKARAHANAGREAEALAALDGFEEQIDALGLGEVHTRHVELARLQYNGGLSPQDRLKRLEKLLEETEGLPAVQVDVELKLGEARLVMADVEPANRADHLDAAEGYFETAVASENVAVAILAGATTGRGDVLYLRATADKDEEGLNAARMQYMRVAVLYPEQSAYAARAMYFAAQCSKELHGVTQDPQELDRQRKLARTLRSRYRGSKWAEDARSLAR